MKEDIRTIPVNDIFMEKKGCPFVQWKKCLRKFKLTIL